MRETNIHYMMCLFMALLFSTTVSSERECATCNNILTLGPLELQLTANRFIPVTATDEEFILIPGQVIRFKVKLNTTSLCESTRLKHLSVKLNSSSCGWVSSVCEISNNFILNREPLVESPHSPETCSCSVGLHDIYQNNSSPNISSCGNFENLTFFVQGSLTVPTNLPNHTQSYLLLIHIEAIRQNGSKQLMTEERAIRFKVLTNNIICILNKLLSSKICFM